MTTTSPLPDIAVDDPRPTMLDRLYALPTWARWMASAAIGIFVLTIAQTLTSGQNNSLTDDGVSRSMLRWAVPILLAGLGGLFSERAGIVNIGLEGMMILGTWFGAWGAIEFGAWGGLVAGLVGGALGGLIHALATVSFGVDHIISGVAINLLAPGVTRYLSDQVFTGTPGGSITGSGRAPSVGDFTMPYLAGGSDTPNFLGWVDRKDIFFISDVAGFSEGLMSQLSYFTIIALALVPISAWVLWKTRLGLRIRICGERPEAGESLGVNVYLHKYIGVVVSGALAGLAGAFIAMELTGFYREDQTNGRGYIGLAALIFGNWRPGGILVGALVFGYPFGLSLRDPGSTRALLLVIAIALGAVLLWSIQRRKRSDIILAAVLGGGALMWYLLSDSAPTWLPNTMPYATVVIVLIFLSQRLRAPAADGQIYRRGGT